MNTERRRIQLPEYLVSGPATKTVRKRDWEARQEQVNYRMPRAVAGCILDIAKQHGVTASEVARAFLEFGMAEYAAGRLTLHPVLRAGRLRLFGDE